MCRPRLPAIWNEIQIHVLNHCSNREIFSTSLARGICFIERIHNRPCVSPIQTHRFESTAQCWHYLIYIRNNGLNPRFALKIQVDRASQRSSYKSLLGIKPHSLCVLRDEIEQETKHLVWCRHQTCMQAPEDLA